MVRVRSNGGGKSVGSDKMMFREATVVWYQYWYYCQSQCHGRVAVWLVRAN